jgi:hypothetical protein
MVLIGRRKIADGGRDVSIGLISRSRKIVINNMVDKVPKRRGRFINRI